MLSAPTKGGAAGTKSRGAVIEIDESDLNYISKLLQAEAHKEIVHRGRWMSPNWRPRSDRLWRKVHAVRNALKNDIEAEKD